jgi:2-polyprenyl-3-methyl-5-hydroxy-6-metoxy-1,4-benzoquinol methylase
MTAEDDRLKLEMTGMSIYHTVPLTPTLSTPGWPVVVPIVDMTLRAMHKIDFRGKRVLDIGCRDGLFCFEAEKLGAAEVVGIDNDLVPGVPEFLIRTLKSKVTIQSLNLFDLRPEAFGRFDVIIFPGVLYHLRYPFWALKLIRDLLTDNGQLVLETAILADDNRHAILFCPTGGESPYEPTSCTFYNRKGLHDTLTSMGFAIQGSECLLKLPGQPTGAGIPDKPPIDRCTTVCRKNAASGADAVNVYWDGPPDAHNIPMWDGKRKSA